MTPFLQLAISLAIIIAAAKAGGYLSYRLGQPAVLGELIVGILLGPTVIDLLNLTAFTDPHLEEVVHELAELGVLLLMFLAGLELNLKDLAKSGKVSALAGTLGVIFPLVLGAVASYYFVKEASHAWFIGLILAATSVSISAQTLMELKVLRSRVGISLLGAAVFDDILVVLGLSVFTAVSLSDGEAGIGSVAWIIVKMILYLGIGAALGFWLLPRLSQKVSSLPVSHGLTAFTLVIILLYGWAAEVLGGMAAITGAFLAGLILARSPVKERIEGSLPVLAYGLFVPIFFVNIGLSTDIGELFGASFWLFVAMTLVAILGKVVGAGLGGLWGGLSRREALQLGIGMMSRGEVGLIVAAVGISSGMIDQAVFSAVVGVVIVTTLLTPPLLRLAFRKPTLKPHPKHPKKQAEKPPAISPEPPPTQIADGPQVEGEGGS
jgi:Kef-type K+ transport system membrane component KefB